MRDKCKSAGKEECGKAIRYRFRGFIVSDGEGAASVCGVERMVGVNTKIGKNLKNGWLIVT